MGKPINLILFLICFLAAQEDNKEKILFVGNSFTFYWNLPLVVESMAKEKGYDFNIYQSTAGGSSLKDHWFEDYELQSKTLISSGQFNRAVLQDYSSNPLNNPVESNLYFKKFINLILENQGKPYLYATWIYDGITNNTYDMADPIQRNLKSVAKSEGAIIVPVDEAFRIFQKTNPEIPLFMSDRKHPSPAGTYLAACVYFSIFTEESSLGLSRRFERQDENGKKIFLIMVEKLTALECQKVADAVCFK